LQYYSLNQLAMKKILQEKQQLGTEYQTVGDFHKKASKTQLKLFSQYLIGQAATASMIAKATGIPQKNICRYKRQLEKAGLLLQWRKGICKETGYSAWYLRLTSRSCLVSQLEVFGVKNAA